MTAPIFVILLFGGVPIAFVLGLAAVAYIVESDNTVLFDSFALQMFGGLENYGLLAIPLFMLTGELMNEGGVTKRLIAAARVFVGGFRGGLAWINLVANMFMAAIVGSAASQIAIMSRAMVPAMEAEGYDRGFAAASTAAGGLLAPVIPPSMLFVIFAVLAQIPVSDMFLAGILPGLLMFGSFAVVIAIIGFVSPFPGGTWMTRAEALRALAAALPAVTIPGAIIGGILFGFATPTESAAVASVVALALGMLVYRELRLSDLWPAFKRTAQNAALVILMIAAANVFGWVVIYEAIPQKLAARVQPSLHVTQQALGGAGQGYARQAQDADLDRADLQRERVEARGSGRSVEHRAREDAGAGPGCHRVGQVRGGDAGGRAFIKRVAAEGVADDRARPGALGRQDKAALRQIPKADMALRSHPAGRGEGRKANLLGGQNLNGAVGLGVGYDGKVDLPPTQCVQRVAAGDVGRNAGHVVLQIADRQKRETGGDVVAKTNAQLAGLAIAQIAELALKLFEFDQMARDHVEQKFASGGQADAGGDALEHVHTDRFLEGLHRPVERGGGDGQRLGGLSDGALPLDQAYRVVDFQVFHGRAPVWCKKRTTAPQN
jgi:tripartite ATP-independent transporter DctM subunit